GSEKIGRALVAASGVELHEDPRNDVSATRSTLPCLATMCCMVRRDGVFGQAYATILGVTSDSG
ncbi:MAG: hypothetical protein ACKOCK_09030, partial [Chloroflexota bacterium]